MSKKFAQINNYNLVKCLGSGVSAKVKLAVIQDDQSNFQQVAIKIFKKNQSFINIEQILNKEIEAMQQLDHPNLIKLIEVLKEVDYTKKNGQTYKVFAIVLEYASSGELFSFVAEKPFCEKMTRFYFNQMMNGLNYMHSKGIAHRDLKPENLLIDSNFNLKIADFGFSTSMGKNQTGFLHTSCGTDGYMAPELYINQKTSQGNMASYVGSSVDVFAAGVVLFIMYAQNPPIRSGNVKSCEHYKMIASHRYEEFWHFHSNYKEQGHYSEDFKDFINNMLSYETSTRLTLSEIVSHPWFQGPMMSHEKIQREFVQRLEIVQAKKMAEKLRRQVLREQKLQRMNDNDIKNNQAMHVGIEVYRSTNSGIKEKKFQGLETQYQNLLSKERQIKDFQSTVRDNDIVSFQVDKNYLFKHLIELYQQKNIVLELSDKQYRINVKIQDNTDILDFNISLQYIDEDQIYVDIRKLEGDGFKFQQNVQKIKNSVLDI